MNASTLPLCSLQRSMILASLRAPGAGAYIVQDVCELEETVDLSLLRRAWQITVRSIPALRRRIEFEGMNPVSLQLQEESDAGWSELDWRDVAPEMQQTRLEKFIEEDRERGFDLRSGVPMRITAVLTSVDRATVIWTSHHALLDGRSYVMVWREWLATYDALTRGEEIPTACRNGEERVPPTPDLENAERYWRECFDGITETTGYIVDRLRTSRDCEAERFAKVSAHFSEEAGESLHRFAASCSVSVNNLVQGAWALLLSRYSSRSEVVFGVTVAGRGAASKSDRRVGFFINTLPLRVTVSDETFLRAWLGQIRSRVLKMREFELTPLDRIAKWSGLAPGTPPFESALVYDHQTPGAALGGGFRNRRLRRLQRTDSPLTLAAYGSPGLSLEIIFDTNLFSRSTMSAALDHLKTLLQAFLHQPDARVGELNMLTEGERGRLAAQYESSPYAETPAMCAHELFEQQARRNPTNIALEFPGGSLSYDQLNRRANRLAWYLRDAGAGAEDLIAIATARSVDAIVAVLAVLKAGAAFLPFDPALPEERFQVMLAAAQPKFILPDSAPSSAVLEKQSDENPPNIAAPANAAYAIYTSGSTGKPKAVVVEHRALVNHSLAAAAAYRLAETDRRLQFASIGTDVFVAEVFNYLSSGAALVLGWDRQGSMREFVRYLADGRITISGMPSGWWNEWVAGMEYGELEMPESLRAVIIGMENAPAAAFGVWKKIAGSRVRLFNAYGPTETAPTATVYEAGSSEWEGIAFVPIGKPLVGMRVHVLDRQGNPVPCGVAGELHIGGPQLARGYLNMPEETAERFQPDRFSDDPDSRLYATGDRGFSLPDGNLVFLGRADRQVKIRGFRVELDEIEIALQAHLGIRQCAVVLGEKNILGGFFTFEGSPPAADELRSFLARRLPPHMIPTAFIALTALPRTASGKIDRAALVVPPVVSSSEAAGESVAALTPTEKRVAAIWEEVLGVRPASGLDDFFQMGGDSLQATRLITLLETHFPREIPLSVLWRAPTLSRMAAMVGENASAMDVEDGAGAVALRQGGTRIPFFCFPGADDNPYYFWQLAQSLDPDQPFYVLRDPRPIEERGVYTVQEAAARSIEDLKSIQPNGPYVVGGHCYGGIVAFETARQLVERGENVGLVALFEVPAPGYPKVIRHWKDYWRQAGALLMRHPRTALAEARAHGKTLRQLFRRKARAVRRRALIDAGLKNTVETLEKSAHPNTQAGLSYDPQPLACDVIQFIAAAEWHSTRVLADPRLAWKEFTRGQFRVCETPGKADAIFKRPYVGELAVRLEEALDRINDAAFRSECSFRSP